MRWSDGITDSLEMSLSKIQRNSEGQGSWMFMGSQRVRHNLATEQQQVEIHRDEPFSAPNKEESQRMDPGE